MLSTRGCTYADLDLAAGYQKKRGPLYNKNEYPKGLVSLANAENLCTQQIMLDFIKNKSIQSLDSSTLTYQDGPFGSIRLRQATSQFVNAHFYPSSKVTSDEVSYVAGVTALNQILARCIAEENEGLLLGMPIYGSFVPDLQTTSKCQLIYTPFGDVDQFSVQAVDCYERAFQGARQNGTRVRALVITNPHNPLGRCYSRDALEAIMRFCNKHDIHLISDEIYSFSVYYTDDSNPGFTSALSIDFKGIKRSLVHVLYGFSKDFASAGLRLGCLISKNSELTKAVRSLARFHWTSPFTDAIAATILEDNEFHTRFLAESQCTLKEHQMIAAKAFNDASIPYARAANAGFFLWIDLSACLQEWSWEAEDALKQKLYDNGVEMSSGRAYHAETPGRFRFLFSVDRDTLMEGLRRIVSFYREARTA
ncbi:hypothetical protein B5807_10458 [Epicoccum nigrum]|uniref:Aminotransferase class I/classII large domain-containing protein n=1 Tax=Epicoccum nigrum TaxID=105696 RepID=A0A1Y2LLE7_EPING|nr:hypothetical protein B5807_10458 [Epicoccum nigrum]